MSAPPAYDNPTCSEETEAPAYPILDGGDLPILLPISHPDNPVSVMLEENDNSRQKTAITVQPTVLICTSNNDEEEVQETCGDKFKFWGCFTCLVFAYVCSAVK